MAAILKKVMLCDLPERRLLYKGGVQLKSILKSHYPKSEELRGPKCVRSGRALQKRLKIGMFPPTSL